MPELPEIEIVKRSLFKMINKAKIIDIKINNFENLWTNKTKYVQVYDLLFADRNNLLKYSAEWAVDLN